MARIPLTSGSGFTVIPEGTHVFRIYDASYDETFGKIELRLKTAEGQTHIERFSIRRADDSLNEGALNAFSYLAKTALNQWDVADVDPAELIGRYFRSEVYHNTAPSSKHAGETVIFVKLGHKSPADGFDREPVARAQATGGSSSAPPRAAESAAPPAKGLDIDALFNNR